MVRPVDISLNIQHAADMARLAGNNQQVRTDLAAQQFAERLEKQTRQQQEQVIRQEEAQKTDVNPDGKGHSGYAAKKKAPAKKKPGAKSAPMARTSGESMFDIRV